MSILKTIQNDYLNIFPYLALFPIVLSLTLYVHNRIFDFVSELSYAKYYAFCSMFFLILPFCWYKSNRLIWWCLAVIHGIAHLVHPAFHGEVPNSNYTPFWDFIVHAMECLCIHMYHKNNLSYAVSVFTFLSTFVAGLTAHVYGQEFMATTPWLILSGGGVLGAVYHMNLLNENKLESLLIANYILWFAPYLGYLDFNFIPYWDNKMNEISLFQMWFLAWFITVQIIPFILSTIQKLASHY